MSKDNAKVIGHQTDASGETYGVWGEVDSETAGSAGVLGVGSGSAPAIRVAGHIAVQKVGYSGWNTSHTTIPSDTEVTIVFDGNRRDDFDAYDVQTGVYTIQEAGDYHVDFMLRWGDFFDSDIVNHRLRVNGSTNRGIRWVKTVQSGTPERGYSKTIFDLTPGDTLEVTVKQFSGEDNRITGFTDEESTYLTIHKVG